MITVSKEQLLCEIKTIMRINLLIVRSQSVEQHHQNKIVCIPQQPIKAFLFFLIFLLTVSKPSPNEYTMTYFNFV